MTLSDDIRRIHDELGTPEDDGPYTALPLGDAIFIYDRHGVLRAGMPRTTYDQLRWARECAKPPPHSPAKSE